MKKIFTILISLSYLTQGFAESELTHLFTPNPDELPPWFTGPLLAPSPGTIPPKHVNIEPYTIFFVVSEIYDSNWHAKSSSNFYSIIEQIPVQIGLADRLDMQIVPQLNYNFTQGQRSVQPGDLGLILDVQLFRTDESTPWPSVKGTFNVSAPTGKNRNLDPKKLGTDGVGSGSWEPTLGLTFGKLYALPKNHYLAPRLSVNYVMQTSVKATGMTVYGGTLDTNGTIRPGNIFWADFGCEYSLTENWALAMDLLYRHTNKSHFSGYKGRGGKMGLPSSDSISLAPAIEYNWNVNLGLIAGFWFSLAGRNSAVFNSGMIAINIYI